MTTPTLKPTEDTRDTTGPIKALRVIRRTGAPPVLFIGDLAYSADALERGQVPGTGVKDELRDSYQKVMALKSRFPDLLIVSSHDGEAAMALGIAKPLERGP